MGVPRPLSGTRCTASGPGAIQIAEDLPGVLPRDRRRPPNQAGGLRETYGQARLLHLPQQGVMQLDHHAVVMHLGHVHELLGGQNRRCRHIPFLQHLEPVGTGPLHQPVSYQSDGSLAVFFPGPARGRQLEPGVRGQLQQVQGYGQLLPEPSSEAAYVYPPAIAAGIHPVGRQAALWFDIVYDELGQLPGNGENRVTNGYSSLVHAGGHMLAPAGRVANV